MKKKKQRVGTRGNLLGIKTVVKNSIRVGAPGPSRSSGIRYSVPAEVARHRLGTGPACRGASPSCVIAYQEIVPRAQPSLDAPRHDCPLVTTVNVASTFNKFMIIG